jgi:polynucleotide 5'-kinase involved in rRNA processing
VAPDAADVLKALDAKIAKRVAQLATKSNPVANPEKAARPSREDRDARRAQKARRMTKNAVTPVS